METHQVNRSVLIVGTAFVAVQLVQLALLLLFEKVDYDTFTFYFSKVELMRWAVEGRIPLAAAEQAFMPIGFSKLQVLFAGSMLWPRNILNFGVAIIGGLIVARHIPRLFLVFVLLTLANNAFFMQYTGYKADAPLAVLSLLLMLTASVPPFRFQLTSLCIIGMLMMSIKWTSAPIMGVAGLVYIPTLARRFTSQLRSLLEDISLASVATAALFGFLELGVYIDTYKSTGSLVPTQSLGVGSVEFRFSNILLGLPQYLLTSVVETFEPIWRRMLLYPWLGGFLETVTLGAKDQVVTAVGAMRQTLNVFDAVGLVASVWVLITRHRTVAVPFVRNCAIAALVSTVAFLSVYPFQPFWMNRYFLPSQVLSYVPVAYAARHIWDNWLAARAAPRRARLLAIALIGIAVVHVSVSAFMLVRDHERNLIRINDVSGVTTKDISAGTVPSPAWLPPIYQQTRMQQTFRGWSGFQVVYDMINRTITPSDPLVIVVDSKAVRADYTYPFLRNRPVANTAIIDLQGHPIPTNASHILCFTNSACSAVASSGMYFKLADQGPTISFWRRL